MPKPVNPANRYIGNPCRNCGSTERYLSGGCVKCTYQAGTRANRNKRTNPQHRGPNKRQIAAQPPKPMPHPHVIESDWIMPPTKARLMAGK